MNWVGPRRTRPILQVDLNNYLFLHSRAMKTAAWNCGGARIEEFCIQAHEIYRLHRLKIAIIVEPRISGARVDQVIQQLDYEKYYRVDPKGSSGGVWMLWNEDGFEVNIILATDRCPHDLLSSSQFSKTF